MNEGGSNMLYPARTTIAIALLAACLSAHAAPSLFGVEMGTRLDSMPKCDTSKSVHPQLCWTSMKIITDDERDIQLMYPTGSLPRYLSEVARAQQVDGKIVEVMFRTNGEPGQAAGLEMLTAKFGKPAHVTRTPLRNAFGTQFVGLRANWKLPGGHAVTFNGIENEVDLGNIELMAPEWATVEAEKDAARAAKKIRP